MMKNYGIPSERVCASGFSLLHIFFLFLLPPPPTPSGGMVLRER